MVTFHSPAPPVDVSRSETSSRGSSAGAASTWRSAVDWLESYHL